MAALAVAALPLCASIPRGYMGSGIPQHSGTCNRTDGAGNSIRYTYDALNRLVARDVFNHETHEKHETFTYDAVGNLLSASNAVAREAFTYDVMNRVETANTIVNGTAFATAWKRDLGGLVTNILYATGKAVTRTYDTDGRLATVSDWLGHTWAFTRDAAGRLTALSCPNGVTGAWTHDANHAVSGWSYNNGSPFAGRVITRDAAGIKTKEQVTAGLFPNPQNPRRAVNTFDAADRLVSATVAAGTNTYAETYLYDLNGAITNKQSAIGNERYEYDCAGRLSDLQLLNPNSSLLLSTEFTYISGASSRTRGQHDRDDRGGKTNRSFVGNKFQAVLYRHPDRAAGRMEETAVRQGIDDRRAGMDHRRRSERGHPG